MFVALGGVVLRGGRGEGGEGLLGAVFEGDDAGGWAADPLLLVCTCVCIEMCIYLMAIDWRNRNCV